MFELEAFATSCTKGPREGEAEVDEGASFSESVPVNSQTSQLFLFEISFYF